MIIIDRSTFYVYGYILTPEVYKTANPYYTDPEAEDSNESNPAEQLPVNAEATNPSSATAQVTDIQRQIVRGIRL